MPDQPSPVRDSIKAIAESLGRLVVIGSAAFSIASFANFSHHKSYWHGTIERVQTVDLNMLSHMLPTKLSQALIEKDEQEIQRTLDSNYGLFGLVVTNCTTSQPDCDQTIQHVSNSQYAWRSLLSNDTIAASTYDVLRDPPPLYTIGSYADSRDPVRDPTGLTNFGSIIGRVYYVRGVPPSFLSTYSRWIKAWPASFVSDSSTNRYYALTTVLFGIGGLSAWSFMELGFSKRRKQLVQYQQQQYQLELAQTELIGEAQDLRQQLKEKWEENSKLIEERSQNTAELETAQQRYQSQEAALRASFQKLRVRLTEQAQAYGKDEQRQTELKTAIQQQQQASELLEKKIADLKAQDLKGARERRIATEKMADLVKAQTDKQKMLDGYAIELEQVWQELNTQTEEREEQTKLVEILRQQIEESERQQVDVSLRQQENRKLLERAKQEKERDRQRIESLSESLENERRQGDRLRNIVNDNKVTNHFERKIANALRDTSKVASTAWSVHSQFDVSEKGRNTVSKFTDCIVIGDSFVAVIEAKNYSGKIHTEGDTRNSVWLSSEGSKVMEIRSSWGNNPYGQVETYVKSAMGLFESNFNQTRSVFRRASKEVSFYGIVVFPDNADFSVLDTDLGKLYSVTHIGDLTDVLHELERQTRKFNAERGRKGLSAADIETCLYGRQSPKLRQRSAA